MQPVMIVTGGSQGIGAAVARLAGARGYAVALTYQSNKAMADGVVDAITAAGGRAIAIQAEMADEASILALFRTVDETFGPVTVLVNNAGGPRTDLQAGRHHGRDFGSGAGGERPRAVPADPRGRRSDGDR